jgi:hypothetical protein
MSSCIKLKSKIVVSLAAVGHLARTELWKALLSVSGCMPQQIAAVMLSLTDTIPNSFLKRWPERKKEKS